MKYNFFITSSLLGIFISTVAQAHPGHAHGQDPEQIIQLILMTAATIPLAIGVLHLIRKLADSQAKVSNEKINHDI